MSLITLRVLDGADRGRAFVDVPTPLTIGREEGNSVQLNDERISRFHLKIQEDKDKVVLTDLQSTNGSKVNGENVQLSILRPGDIIAVGRTVLVFGSREDVARRLADLRGADLSAGVPRDAEEEGSDVDLEGPSGSGSGSVSLEFELNYADEPDAQATLHTLTPPELPEELSPGQAAQLAELLQYVHLRIRGMVKSVESEAESQRVTLDQRQWQNLIDLHDRLAIYLRSIGEPGE
jgi:pSer/pThr/pTyr-binding forkhead associated (FHA) protein